MYRSEREKYFIEQEEKLLASGAAFSEWCVFISKSVYDAFVNGADLATVITALACIETYFRTEDINSRKKNLCMLIDEYPFIDEETREKLHKLRKYRNQWVHINNLDDTLIIKSEDEFLKEVEEEAVLAVNLLMKVLFSQPFI